MTVVRMHEWDADTRVDAAGDGRFTAHLTDRWSGTGGRPNGGYLVAFCLRALGEVLPHPDPLVVGAHYLRPGVVGPAQVDTEVVRAGRRLSTGEARLRCGDREVLRVVASYADLGAATGRTHVLGAPPDLPPPDECGDVYGGARLPDVTVADRVDLRAPEPHGWATGRPTGTPTTEFWIRFADGRPADTASLASLVDSAAPAVLELGETDSATVELTVHVRARPASDWLAARVTTRHVLGGFHEEDVELWDTSGRLVAQSRQLALLPTR
ncbi:thioesterase family protein [Saccharothrix hoggarensis]|uniref:Thioesterase family protein n=1 Tax=Saccharothrix hoggarensis TaxID=913853 RepID=A0ABW3R140_9PSEU